MQARSRRSASRRSLISTSRRRRLRFETLEARRLLTQAMISHAFREEDFSISGSFGYLLQESGGYRDAITNGAFSSQAGRVEWTGPKDGTGFFQGTATGDGKDSFLVGSTRRNCSEYGIEDKGSFDFTVDAQQQTLRIDSNVLDSIRYTYYRDASVGRVCPAPDPPWSRFFGGVTDIYVGTFNPATSQASIRYTDTNPNLSISTAPAQVVWENNGPTDLSLTVEAIPPDIDVPDGWIILPQTTEPPETPSVDLSQGLQITVDLSGRPLPPPSDILQVAARVRLFWTQAENDVNRLEIPIDTQGEPLGLFWNSRSLSATIQDFPEPPFWANYVKVEVDRPGSDLTPEDNFQFLRIETFEARNDVTPPLAVAGQNQLYLFEDELLNGLGSSILNLSDSMDPDVRVYAYNPISAMGAHVHVADDEGGFTYDPRQAPAIQALALGETANDAMEFIAIKYQALVSSAVHIVLLKGVNDQPVAVDTEVVTWNDQPFSFDPTSNDYDIDNGDKVSLLSVQATSALGATVTISADGESVIYDPASSELLQSLELDEERIDSFTYRITDLYGATAEASVYVTVIGVEQIRPPVIAPIPIQFTVMDTATSPIPISISHATADLNTISVVVHSDRSDLFPSEQLDISGSGGIRTLIATPTPALVGRAQITLTATDLDGNVGQVSFSIIVGTLTDQDLDGIPDAEEDASPNEGDMNRDGVPDRRQPHVVSLRSAEGDAYVNLQAAQGMSFQNVAAVPAPNPDGIAENALFPLGLVHFELDLWGSQSSALLTLTTDYAALPLNAAFFHVAEGDEAGWHRLMWDGTDGVQIHRDRLTAVLVDGGRTDADGAADGILTGSIAFAHVTNPWQNVRPEDVNNDGVVSPIDVLLVINALNRRGAGSLGATLQAGDQIPGYVDVSGDNQLSPVDAVIVINWLNRNSAGEGELETADDVDEQLGSAQGASFPTLDEIFATTKFWRRSVWVSDEGQQAARGLAHALPVSGDRHWQSASTDPIPVLERSDDDKLEDLVFAHPANFKIGEATFLRVRKRRDG